MQCKQLLPRFYSDKNYTSNVIVISMIKLVEMSTVSRSREIYIISEKSNPWHSRYSSSFCRMLTCENICLRMNQLFTPRN